MAKTSLANLNTVLALIETNLQELRFGSSRVDLNLQLQIRNTDIGLKGGDWSLFDHLQTAILVDIEELISLSQVTEKHLKSIIETLTPMDHLPNYPLRKLQKSSMLGKILAVFKK